MTAPIIIRRKGPGQSIQESFSPILQQLQFDRVRAQQREQLDIQRQNLELQQLQQRETAKQRTSQRFFQLMDAFGPDVLSDPMVAQQVTELGLDPKTLLRGHKERQRTAEKQRGVAEKAFLDSLTPETRPGVTAFLSGLQSGLGQEASTALMRQVFEGQAEEISPERLEKLATEFPDLFGPDAGITAAEGLEQLVGIRREQAEITGQFGPGFKRRIDTELQQLRLREDLREETRNILGKVTEETRVRAALRLSQFVENDLDTNRAAYQLRFPGFFQLSQIEKIAKVYGRNSAVFNAMRKVPGIIAGAVTQ
ncbi:hypothetical protein LCGC14_2588700 [marine sediment metagenome]|uniref:Uncharacterized protein n=1 Tax=marine sediment metagenome TaxID=412755 RepID=A0A0F9ACL7_9ZZZZ